MSDIVPDGIEPIVAWRQWRITFERGVGQRPILGSVAHKLSWPGRERAEATCAGGHDHAAPDVNCRCGLYATRLLGSLIMEYEPAMTRPPDFTIVGRCHFWGQIVEHEGGIRAQYGYPDRLWLIIPELWDDMDAMAMLFREMMPTCDMLQDAYGVPCTPAFVRELEEISGEVDHRWGMSIFAMRPQDRAEYRRSWRVMLGYGSSSTAKPTQYTVSQGGKVAITTNTKSLEYALKSANSALVGTFSDTTPSVSRVRRFMWAATFANVVCALVNLGFAFKLL